MRAKTALSAFFNPYFSNDSFIYNNIWFKDMTYTVCRVKMIYDFVRKVLRLHLRAFPAVQQSTWDTNIDVHEGGNVFGIDESQVVCVGMHEGGEFRSDGFHVLGCRGRCSQGEQGQVELEIREGSTREIH